MPILTAWLSRYIELNHCQKVLTESDMRLNEYVPTFNEKLMLAKQSIYSNVPEVLPFIRFENVRSLIEEHYSLFDLFKINAPFFGFLPSFFLFGATVDYCQYKRFPNSDGSGEFLVWSVGIGVVLMVLSWLRYDDFPIGFLGVFGGVSAGFLGLACVKTLLDMRSSREDSVELKNIPALLKECEEGHIVIE